MRYPSLIPVGGSVALIDALTQNGYNMSNLNLGNVSFAGLIKRLSNTGRAGRSITLAYATTATLVEQDGSTDEYVVIRHHGSVIAEVADHWVYVTNAGYSSTTTRTRINKVLVSNNVPLYVSQRNFAQCLFNLANDHELLTDDFRGLVWDHDGGLRYINSN